MKRDILPIIKISGATRKFRNKRIPSYLLSKIVEAGRWGCSILGIQPWTIVATMQENIIINMADITLHTSSELSKPFGLILRLTSQTIRNSRAIIGVYNNKKISKRTYKYGEPYISKARIAELQAIGGAIQNMLLEANSLGLGAVWLDSPTFFNTEDINRLFNYDGELIALIGLGYAEEKSRRSSRSNYTEMIKVI